MTQLVVSSAGGHDNQLRCGGASCTLASSHTINLHSFFITCV